MKRPILLLFLLLITTHQAAAFDYEPWIYRQDFENGELNAWSSYPPIQDTAYEAPFIYPGQALPGDTGTSLCKILYPQAETIQLTGAVKRLPMRLDSASRLKFRYCVKATVKPSWLGIDLPLANGQRIRARFPAPALNTWLTADYGIADLLAAAGLPPCPALDITAVAITLRFEKGDPDMPILFGLDDVSVSGSKKEGFFISTPDVTFMDERREGIALKHYHNGESLDIAASCSSEKAETVKAVITRFDKSGVPVAEYRLKRDTTGMRTSKPISLDAKTFPPGIYEVTLTGYAGKDKEPVAETVFAFTVADKGRFDSHPRLRFEAETKEAFKQRLATFHPEFLDFVRSQALDARERLTPDLPYDLPYFPEVGWLSSFEAYRTRIATIPQRALDNAMVYALDGDTDAAEWAETALVNLCTWPTWTHPFMKKRGHEIYLYQTYTTAELGLAYDILYDRLSEAERKTVCDAFVRNGLKPAYHTYVLADMVTNDESNWIVAIVGGSLLAGCSIIGDIEDSSALEPYLTGCLYKLRDHLITVYSGDSGFIEGFSYGLGTMRHYAEYLPVIEETLGVDFEWMFKDSCNEALWAADHDKGVYFTFGDAHVSGGNTFACLPWLVEHFRDGNLAWLYSINRATPTAYTFDAILHDITNVTPTRPELSGAKLFSTTGTAVFRSDNGPKPFVFTFRCGPFGNHQHIDQGTFYLHDRGETLITEFGYSNYYDDPYYQSHVIQPVGHNCILVDGNPLSQRTGDHATYAAGMNAHARIPSFIDGQSLAWAEGDLSQVYVGNVEKLSRGVLYVPPRTVVILDRMKAREGDAATNTLFHGPKFKDMKADGQSFTIGSGSQILKGTVLFPEDGSMTLEPDKVKLSMFTDAPVEPLGCISVNGRTRNGTSIAAYMLSTENAVGKMEKSRESKRFDIDGASVLVNPEHEMLTNGPIGTDGVFAALSGTGALLVVEGTTGAVDNRRVFHADTAVTVLVEGETIRYSSHKAATLFIRADKKPKTVFFNGEKTNTIKYDTNEVVVEVPAGYGRIELRP